MKKSRKAPGKGKKKLPLRQSKAKKGGALTRDFMPPKKRGARPPHARAEKHRRERLAEGVFSATRQGYGFVRAEELSEEVFIPSRHTGGALHGDRVAVRVTEEEDGRLSGVVTQILAYGREAVVGTLYREAFARRERRQSGERRRYYVVPDDPRYGSEIEVKNDFFREGDKVRVKLRRDRGGLSGEVTESFGPAGTRDAGYAAILDENGIRTVFPEAVLAEAEEAAREVLSDERRIRPKEVILTIDGSDAKDLDDAISLTEEKNGRWRLGVHIADVSHYVKPGSEVEKEAFLRGTSVYFVDKVVPMLPEALSNRACSLNAGEDKYALSAYMTLSPKGVIEKTEIYPTVIRSAVRGVYDEVNDIFEKDGNSSFYKKYENVNHTLQLMRKLYGILDEKAARRGVLSFESSEAKILLDEDGAPIEIAKRERGDAEKMIEAFMLTANEAVATLLHQKGLPCVYRVHEEPDSEKIGELLQFAKSIGLPTSEIPKKAPTPMQLEGLLDAALAKDVLTPVSYLLLRSMAKARYSASETGHYGLNLELYAHFTSPIRRLSDLATHRILHCVLLTGPYAGGYTGRKEDPAVRTEGKGGIASYQKYAERAALAASEGELRALAAERGIDALYKTLYMSRRVGEELSAEITSITSFGVFCMLPNTCEGLALLSEMEGRYTVDHERHLLVGSHATYRLGDKVRVRVTDTDMNLCKIYFTLLEKIKEKAPV